MYWVPMFAAASGVLVVTFLVLLVHRLLAEDE